MSSDSNPAASTIDSARKKKGSTISWAQGKYKDPRLKKPARPNPFVPDTFTADLLQVLFDRALGDPALQLHLL